VSSFSRVSRSFRATSHSASDTTLGFTSLSFVFDSNVSIFILSCFVCLMISVGLKKKFLVAKIASPPVEVTPAAVTITFAIQTGHIRLVRGYFRSRHWVHFNNMTNELVYSGHPARFIACAPTANCRYNLRQRSFSLAEDPESTKS